jgi:hypothetical protein
VERGKEAVRRPCVLSPSACLWACQEGKVGVFFCLYWMKLERSGWNWVTRLTERIISVAGSPDVKLLICFMTPWLIFATMRRLAFRGIRCRLTGTRRSRTGGLRAGLYGFLGGFSVIKLRDYIHQFEEFATLRATIIISHFGLSTLLSLRHLSACCV